MLSLAEYMASTPAEYTEPVTNRWQHDAGESVPAGKQSGMQCRIGAFDVALALAVEGSKHCNRKVELRPFLEG
jgi:hypothetical protein